MATPAQILANRQNASKSTGPRSAEGKAVSRFNALKTGIDAKSQVIRGEDAAELEALAANYEKQFQPADPLERFLVDSLINAEWQLRRLRKVEASLWEREISNAADPLAIFDSPAFNRLQRRIDAAERSYHRVLKELHRARKEAAAAQPSKDDPEIGLVPSPATHPRPTAADSLPAPRPSRSITDNLALRL